MSNLIVTRPALVETAETSTRTRRRDEVNRDRDKSDILSHPEAQFWEQIMSKMREFAGFIRDLNYGWRLLCKGRAVSLFVILSLGLGIGASTAAFTLVKAVLFQATPYPDPDRLIRISQKGTGEPLSGVEHQFLRTQSSSIISLAGYRAAGDRLIRFAGAYESVTAMLVTADFFRTLGVVPVFGRGFLPEETSPSGPKVAILTDHLWHESFGDDPATLGRTVRLDDGEYLVVGILPSTFWFPQPADIFLPLRSRNDINDRGRNLQTIARLKPDVRLNQMNSELELLSTRLQQLNPSLESTGYRGLAAVRYDKSLVNGIRLNLLLLFGVTGLLLLITCSNLASLVLTRLATRQREIAVRLAIGSSRGRLLRQFIAENIALTIPGALLGIVSAHWLLLGILRIIPFPLPTFRPINLDGMALAFAISVTLVTGVVLGVLPLTLKTSLRLAETLRVSSHGSGSLGTRQQLRQFLVACEVALSTMLLLLAVLLIQSLLHLTAEPLGFTTRDLIAFRTLIPAERHRSGAELWNYESTFLQRLRTVRGITAVGIANILPFEGQNNLPAQHQGHPEHSIGGTEIRTVSGTYFAAMNIPLVRGRLIEETDTASAPPIVIINEMLVRRWWPGQNPIGDHVEIGKLNGRVFPEITEDPREIVGIVRDTRTSLVEPPRPTVYIPIPQLRPGLARGTGSMSWIVRTNVPTQELRKIIVSLDPYQSLRTIRPMDNIIDATTSVPRFDAWLFGAFAGLALFLAALGIYGLLSFWVARRTSEIATRMALGATRMAITRLILTQGMSLVIIGLIAGTGGALAVSPLLSKLFFGVRPSRLSGIALVCLIVAAVGVLSTYLPARRASRLDPMIGLRIE